MGKTTDDEDFYVCEEFECSHEDILKRTHEIMNADYNSTIFHKRIYLLTTYWTYPFGGGEEFMYDTMKWATQLGMKTYWIAFTDSKNRPFTDLKVRKEKYGTIIDVPGGFTVADLSNWIRIIKPDIVHHQGHARLQFYLACEPYRVEFISGFHFWTGGIILDSIHRNILIKENAEYHATDPDFELLCKKDRVTMYCASVYVQECFEQITGVFLEDVIFPSSSIERYLLKNVDDDGNEILHDPMTCIDGGKGYVVMVNIHKHKGGEIFYYMLTSCPKIKFMCVRTEHESEELDNKIYNEIERRNKLHEEDPDNYAPCIFMERTLNVKEIYSRAGIMLCASAVDETFCRVVNEAMMNGIPTLTTCRGNIRYLINGTTPELDFDNHDEWKQAVEKIYYDDDEFRRVSDLMREEYKNSSENIAKQQFAKVMEKILLRSKEMSVGIFSPWCDQGLGIQSRNYYRILEKAGFKVSVFGLKPYNADTCIALQRKPEEWVIDNVYYSPNTREEVRDIELLEFCREYNVGKMLVPETCWIRVFQVGKLLGENGVKAYAIPNIEIVRRDEIYKHNYFHKILANNFLCERIFEPIDVPCNYIGYAIEGLEFREKVFEDDTIGFLFIGGMNAFSRKHIISVCEGFDYAYKKVQREGLNIKFHLTATVQMTNSLETDLKARVKDFENEPWITLIQNHMPYSEIIGLYYKNHIGIQVSKHEGLGLGFYEGVSSGTPVLTLKTPPHNEIILDGINGWATDCYHKEMKDNKCPLFGSAYFDPEVLGEKIIQIANREEIERVIENLKKDNATRLNLETFSKRFVHELME
jgi:glycosyltransferase involved in cell wall biosynthesis